MTFRNVGVPQEASWLSGGEVPLKKCCGSQEEKRL
jgi:hypothetical protein